MHVHVHCFQGLQQILQTLNPNDHLIVPHAHFLSLFKHFYPQLATTVPIETPSMLLETIGCRPIPPGICTCIGSINGFQDPSTIHLPNAWIPWLQAQQFYSWTWPHLPNIADNHRFREVHRYVLLGHFPEPAKTRLCTFLKSQGVQIMVVEYSVCPKASLNACSESFLHTASASPALEYRWIENTKCTQPKAYGLLLPHALSLQTLFQNPLPTIPSAWLDWQDQGTLQAFSLFLKHTTDVASFQNYQKDMEAFINTGIPTNFTAFYHWLTHNDESTWLRPYTPPTWPQQNTLDQFIQQLTDRIGSIPSLQIFHLENLETCPIPIHRRQFFAILRKHLQIQSGHAHNMLPIEDARYFPIVNAFVPMCIRTDPQQDANHCAKLLDLAQRGCTLSIHYALQDKDGNQQAPLFAFQTPPKTLEKRTIIVSNARPQNSVISTLRLPKGTRFSAKTWEDFYRHPIATWLQKVLKAHRIRLHNLANKQMLMGIWTHDNLQFTEPPSNLEAWLNHIRQHSDERWEQLAPSLTEPTLLFQWHQRALLLSQQIARKCTPYFQDSWILKSEWELPKKACYSGRIDLLAYNPSTKQSIIIDYKTGFHYKPTPQSGEGLQLALYGIAVQSLKNSTNNQISLQAIQPNWKETASSTLEAWNPLIQWTTEVSQNGIYQSIPHETDDLPLAYAVAIKRY